MQPPVEFGVAFALSSELVTGCLWRCFLGDRGLGRWGGIFCVIIVIASTKSIEIVEFEGEKMHKNYLFL